MVRCSDVEFAAFQKRKSSKKGSREVGDTSRVGITLKGEAPSAAPITEAAGAEVKAYADLLKVLGETIIVREPVEIPEVVEVVDGAEAPIKENSSTWAMGES